MASTPNSAPPVGLFGRWSFAFEGDFAPVSDWVNGRTMHHRVRMSGSFGIGVDGNEPYIHDYRFHIDSESDGIHIDSINDAKDSNGGYFEGKENLHLKGHISLHGREYELVMWLRCDPSLWASESARCRTAHPMTGLYSADKSPLNSPPDFLFYSWGSSNSTAGSGATSSIASANNDDAYFDVKKDPGSSATSGAHDLGL